MGINIRDVKRQGREHNTDDEYTQMKYACWEYIHYELKMSKEMIKNLDIVKIFKDKRVDFDRLYVEFKEESSVKLCFRHSPKMRKEKYVRLFTYISPELSELYQAHSDHAFLLRNPEIGGNKLKTRIRYGTNTLILEAK